jgi:hypothetical protein
MGVPSLARVTIPEIAPLEEKVKFTPLLAVPPTVTTTRPLVALLGTDATMEVALQLVGLAATPLKVTVPVPTVDPNPVPEIVTKLLGPPEFGEMLLILGVWPATRNGEVKTMNSNASSCPTTRFIASSNLS